jgi:PhnB protein
MWFRQTMGLGLTGGGWKILHEHESVPFHMDGSARAAIELTP